MKFFWKIFFATMFISIACFALGGYILIHSNFNALLDSEVQTAFDYNDIVYYSLENEFKDRYVSSPYFTVDQETDAVHKAVTKVAQSININNTNQKVTFGVFDVDESIIFSSLPENFDKDMLSSLKGNQVGWSLKEKEGRMYVQTIRPVVFQRDSLYIEMLRNVTYIFENQQAQYQMLIKIMAGMLALGGLVTFTVSKLLMRRIVSLTKVTKDISAGNLSKRSSVKGRDEFTALSRDFNRMADNLEGKMNELRETAEKKELFIGAFSHELKTPLTSVIGYSDMLRRKKMSEEQIHTCAEYIFAQGKRLERLSMRLLDLIVLRSQKAHFVPVDMETLFEEISFIAGQQLMQSDIKLSYNIEHAIIALEPELMKSVFINLIDNARKSINGGGQISIKGRWHEDSYIVSIQDTGKGMEKQELSKIMEAFYMVDKSRSREQGSVGLGLTICDEILKLHGFEIAVESTVGIGTTVTIILKGGER